jgi:pimeloyl-ACP methyl ester carboxylesterase
VPTVFSRYGYGRSSARPLEEPLPRDFMEQQAWEVLPLLFAKLELARPWLFGHSDGASIALLYAARFSDRISGAVVLAPHVLVEPISVASIAAARTAYVDGALRERLARYHDDVDSAFWGWNTIWLDPAFRDWDMRPLLSSIGAPLLAIQGEGDEYGTLEQVHAIGRLAPHAEVLVLPDCGHSPHRDQPGRVIEAAGAFMLNR